MNTDEHGFSEEKFVGESVLMRLMLSMSANTMEMRFKKTLVNIFTIRQLHRRSGQRTNGICVPWHGVFT
jgi:hypothetical protein